MPLNGSAFILGSEFGMTYPTKRPIKKLDGLTGICMLHLGMVAWQWAVSIEEGPGTVRIWKYPRIRSKLLWAPSRDRIKRPRCFLCSLVQDLAFCAGSDFGKTR